MAEISFTLAGTKYGDLEALPRLGLGTRLLLRREPHNKFDRNAVSVWVGREQVNGGVVGPGTEGKMLFKLGMIPAKPPGDKARRLAEMMDAGAEFTASVQQHNGLMLLIKLVGDKVPA